MAIMEATIYLGARDMEERMRHRRATGPRLFADLAAAKAYTLSGMDKARELIEAQKRDLIDDEEGTLIQANDFLEKLGGIRSLVADLVLVPGVNNEQFKRFVDVPGGLCDPSL